LVSAAAFACGSDGGEEEAEPHVNDSSGADDGMSTEATGADATSADATGADAIGADAIGTDATGADATGVEAMDQVPEETTSGTMQDVADETSTAPEMSGAEPEATSEASSSTAIDENDAPELLEDDAPPVSSGVEVMDEPEVLDEAPQEPVTMGRTAYDLVELGNTGIVTSRLAMGSGTNGVNGSSVQTRLGGDFSDLLVEGYDRGIRFFETADAYGTHNFIREAMRQVGRENVTLLTKTTAETREDAEADLERFMEELGTDYFDIVLLHLRESPNWVAESEGAMEVLAEAKARGQIRAHGVSCHTLEALELAAETDWVDLDLARINPFGLRMDADPDTVVGVLEGMKNQGKAVLGMKILAQGDALDRFDEAIEYATRLECIHGFTIGFRSMDQLDEVAAKIAAVTPA
jgi:aryl-alcohol dehydrogenase-like predicted oxidoreductase